MNIYLPAKLRYFDPSPILRYFKLTCNILLLLTVVRIDCSTGALDLLSVLHTTVHVHVLFCVSNTLALTEEAKTLERVLLVFISQSV